VIEQAAAELRSGAIRAGYAGVEHKHVAFALAMVLDELARHVRELRPEVREQVVRGARMLLGHPRSPAGSNGPGTAREPMRRGPKPHATSGLVAAIAPTRSRRHRGQVPLGSPVRDVE
jgi:hypothetical protein